MVQIKVYDRVCNLNQLLIDIFSYNFFLCPYTDNSIIKRNVKKKIIEKHFVQ